MKIFIESSIRVTVDNIIRVIREIRGPKRTKNRRLQNIGIGHHLQEKLKTPLLYT